MGIKIPPFLYVSIRTHKDTNYLWITKAAEKIKSQQKFEEANMILLKACLRSGININELITYLTNGWVSKQTIKDYCINFVNNSHATVEDIYSGAKVLEIIKENEAARDMYVRLGKHKNSSSSDIMFFIIELKDLGFYADAKDLNIVTYKKWKSKEDWY